MGRGADNLAVTLSGKHCIAKGFVDLRQRPLNSLRTCGYPDFQKMGFAITIAGSSMWKKRLDIQSLQYAPIDLAFQMSHGFQVNDRVHVTKGM